MRYPALALTLFLAGSSVAGASGFNGLYATSPFLASTKKNLPDSVYQSAVFGVYVRLEWSVIEPNQGQYDWSTLDAETSRAVASGKQISIGVATGNFSPAWLYSEGVGYGTFVVNDAQGNCLTVTIPVPWDPTYQQEYATMLSALSAHLQSSGAYNTVQVVKITPMNEWTEEMRVPSASRPGKTGCQQVSNAVTIWQSLGYRPSKVVDAWNEAAQSVANAFPGKVLGIPILNNNDFPMISETGRALSSKKARGWVDVKGEIITSGISTFASGFIVGWQALGQTETSSVVTNAGANGAIEGWQTNEHLSTQQAGCDSSPGNDYATCTDSPYQNILDNGIAAGSPYIEIWPNDLLAFPDAVAEAQGKL